MLERTLKKTATMMDGAERASTVVVPLQGGGTVELKLMATVNKRYQLPAGRDSIGGATGDV